MSLSSPGVRNSRLGVASAALSAGALGAFLVPHPVALTMVAAVLAALAQQTLP